MSLQAVEQQLLLRCTFPPAGTSVQCAVSGGADSLALLVLAVAARCNVTAVHVDHGIRPESHEDAAVVAAAAARFGADFLLRHVEVRPGPNLEARARAARYSVLDPGTFLGHTADDQAETVVINLLRGTGLDGLSGMKPDHRPILALRRSDTSHLCSVAGLIPIQDPTNEDRRFLRNVVRHELLPALSNAADRDVVPILVREAEIMREDADLLNEQACRIDATDARALSEAPRALARRAVREWLRPMLDDELHPPGLAAVDRVLDVARGAAKACDVVANKRVVRSSQRLALLDSPGRKPNEPLV